MKKKPMLERFGDFIEGKGFYIALSVCVAAIGISGFYLFSHLGAPSEVLAAAPTKIIVTPAPRVIIPSAPVVTVAPTATPSPTATPAPAATPAPKVKKAAAIFTWPVKGEVLEAYSVEALAFDKTMADWRTHAGIDIAATLGTQVLAVSDGTVEAIAQDDLMGTVLTISHGDGLESVYANLAATPTVELGEAVTTGAVIGSVGSTAIAEGAAETHLHLEFYKDGSAVDPLQYLPK